MNRSHYLGRIASALRSVDKKAMVGIDLGCGTNIIAEVGLDSLQMAEFILKLEDEFAITIDFGKVDYETFTRVGDLLEFLAGVDATAERSVNDQLP